VTTGDLGSEPPDVTGPGPDEVVPDNGHADLESHTQMETHT